MRCVVYRYAVSLGVVTFYRTSRVYAVSNTKSAILRGIPYSLLSLLVGWWCFPWGFIRTIQALIVNFSGGENITTQTKLDSQDPKLAKATHGYPNLERVRKSLKLLYKHFPNHTLHSFTKSILPRDISIKSEEDPVIAAHRVAGAIVRHFNLPQGSILVNYRQSMEHPGRVELTPENEYLVELHTRYKEDPRDVAAILAHEITHVFLYRAGLWLPNEYDNEILTDTASTYLGVGWLGLNAFRVTESQQPSVNPGQVHIQWKEERLGYLTPEEFGYVLGKRAITFQENMDGLITSSAARKAFQKGFHKAKSEYRQPPLKKCSFAKRVLYWWNQKYIRKLNRTSGLEGLSRSFAEYQFDVSDEVKVVFECPVCSQKLRLPVKKNIQARCRVCQSSFECKT